jgi:hypothetical protein
MKIPDRQDALKAFYREHLTDPPREEAPSTNGHGSKLSDEEVIRRVNNESTDKGARLFEGDISGYPSQSEADMAFCQKVAFWTKVPDQIERVWRASKLWRGKGDTHRSYAAKTIERAIDRTEETYREAGIKVGSGKVTAPEPTLAPDPVMDGAAYSGVFGEAVALIEPHVESDPAALLLSTITAFGNALGRGPYIQVGADKHRGNLYTALVGDTAKARKGMSWKPVRDVMHTTDKAWTEGRLSSGEGLIAEVRDAVERRNGDGEMKTIDPGVKDKRLLIMEGELSQALKVMKREGNTLSPIMRNAWDGETLKTMVKHSPLRATDPTFRSSDTLRGPSF